MLLSVLEATNYASFNYVDTESNKETVTIIQDDETKRVAESVKEDGNIEVVTLDKKTTIVTIEDSNKKAKVIDLGQQMETIEKFRSENSVYNKKK